jgi:uncharacterized protein YciI
MVYYAAILHMQDVRKNEEVRSRHIEYLDRLDEQGNIFARGPFMDGSGGLVVYIAGSYDEARVMAENDPHVLEQSRLLELKEWNLISKFSKGK